MKIGDVKKITVTQHHVRRPDFGDACNDAHARALDVFGLGEFGHSEKVDFDRTTDSLVVEFKGYRHTSNMGGQETIFIFEAWIDRYEEDGS
jgi:hypothetical protein